MESKKETIRNQNIKKCNDCSGDPPKKEFKIEGHISGVKCDKCSEVIKWKKEE